MKVAFQINKINSLNLSTDSSWIIMTECYNRGFEVWFYYPESLSYLEGEITSLGFAFDGTNKEVGEFRKIELNTFDFVFVRQDPPFDMPYITSTYLLEKLTKPKVLNSPASIRNCPEKLFVLDFANFMPKTIITSNKDEILKFWRRHQEVVLKPVYAHGGQGVFYISQNDKNINNVIRILTDYYGNVPIIAQQYIANVAKGDKRILLVDGECVGAINRMQGENSAISNTVAGGGYEKTVLTSTEEEICKVLKPKLKALGLFLVGIDVIDDMITEINVTSPTGFSLFNKLEGASVEKIIVDKMLQL